MSATISVDVEAITRELERNGFVIVPDLIARDDALRMAARIRELVGPEGPGDKGLPAGIFNSIAPEDDELFLQLCANPVYWQVAERMLGPEYRLNGDMGCLWVQPGGAAGGMHLDIPAGWYQNLQKPVPKLCFGLNSIWMLTDFTRANGATQVVPGSHVVDGRPDDRTFANAHALEGSAGSLAIINASLWHQSGPNRTADRHRIGISAPMVPWFVDPISCGWKQLRKEVHQRLPPAVQRLLPYLKDDDGRIVRVGKALMQDPY